VPLNLLVSLPYVIKGAMRELLQENRDHVRLLVDSGAFTAWRSGNPLTLDAYLKMMESVPIKPWRYFTLDVVGDPVATRSNFDELLRQGLHPVPIFTRGASPETLDYYYEHSDVVAVGGLVGTRGNKGYVNGIMRLIGERKVHWLGFTHAEYLRRYRPYMCDSSSSSMAKRFAMIRVYVGHGEFMPVTKRAFFHRVDPKIDAAIRQLGVDPYLLRHEKNWHGHRISDLIGMRSAVAFQCDLWTHLRTNVFTAITPVKHAAILLDAMRDLGPQLIPKEHRHAA